MRKIKQELLVIITMVLTLGFVLAGAASAVSYSVEVPSSLTPGSTAQGTLYFTNGSGEKVVGFNALIVTTPNLNFVGNLTPDSQLKSELGKPKVSSRGIAIGSAGSYTLPSDKVAVATFNFIVPEIPGTYYISISNDANYFSSIATEDSSGNWIYYSRDPSGNIPLTTTSTAFTIPGTIPDMHLQVELPEDVNPGATVEGSVYILGGNGLALEGYTISLCSETPTSDDLNIQITDVPIGYQSKGPRTIVSSNAVTLTSDKELVCKFTMDVPSSCTACSVGFNQSMTELITTNYAYANFDDGDTSHVHKCLVAIPGISAVSGSGSSTPSLDIVLPECLPAGSNGTGTVYLVGGSGQTLEGLQMSLIESGSESLGISIANESGKVIGGGVGTIIVSGTTLVYQNINGLPLTSSRVKVCEFTFTIPSSDEQMAYAIDFICDPSIGKDTRVTTGTLELGKTDTGSGGKSYKYLQTSGDVLYIGEDLKLVKYNGYVVNKIGVYLKNATTGLNVTDVLTEVELASSGVQTPDTERFNATFKSEMVYKCGKSFSKDGYISSITQYPVFYSISGANTAIIETVVVDAFNSTGGKISNSSTAFINTTTNTLQHDCDLTDSSITYLNITFTGRMLGDVDNSSVIDVDDATSISKYLIPSGSYTPQDEFYADTDQNLILDVDDATCISKYLLPDKPNPWM